MDISKIDKIHFVGIGGIGVSAVAKMMLTEGKSVSGSDPVEGCMLEPLRQMGAMIHVGHRPENVPDDADLLVYSAAFLDSDPERARAAELGIRQLNYFQFLGELSKDRFTIGVSGTNGKTTTTALLGLMMERAGMDPTVIVGGEVREFGGNARVGRGEYFVVEACEYRAHMLELDPEAIILTNIEEDHLDYFRDIAHIREVFQKYIDRLPQAGLLVYNNDDPEIAKLDMLECRTVSYGIENAADIRAENIRIENGCQYFEVCFSSRFQIPDSRFQLQVPGRFNVYNALAAAACAIGLGADPEAVQAALADWRGVGRRFEILGELRGATVISDYAHHPTAVSGTIAAAREFYPGRRIVAVFQPHQGNRTRNLLSQFVESLAGADVIVLPEIFGAVGRERPEDAAISSEDLAKKIKDFKDAVFYAESLEAGEKIAREMILPGDVVLVMGAANGIHKVAENLCK